MNRELLSRLIDADLPETALGNGLATLATEGELREAVTVYQIIGDALRGRAVEDDGYSRRIFAALDREVIKR